MASITVFSEVPGVAQNTWLASSGWPSTSAHDTHMAGLPLRSVFVRRRPTGEVWTPELHAQYPGRDWILSRILWLSGCEPGRNRLHDVDTMRRYIYLHGTNHEDQLGRPVSHGCVRMRVPDVINLYRRVHIGTPVYIR